MTAATAANALASALPTTRVVNTGAIFASTPVLIASATMMLPPFRAMQGPALMNLPRMATAIPSTTTKDAVRRV